MKISKKKLFRIFEYKTYRRESWIDYSFGFKFYKS